MRTPFVKRQTPPLSGFLLFFRFPGARRSRSSVACPDLISVHRCTPTWLHQTLIEARSPVRASAEKVMSGSLRPRNNFVPVVSANFLHGFGQFNLRMCKSEAWSWSAQHLSYKVLPHRLISNALFAGGLYAYGTPFFAPARPLGRFVPCLWRRV